MRKIIWCFMCLSLSLGLFAQQSRQTNKKAIALFQDASNEFRTGKTEKALELLDRAKSIDAGFSVLYLLQADIFNKKGDKKQEIQAIEVAVALDSLKGRPYYFLVLADGYFDQADYEKAQTCYRLYLQKDTQQRAGEQAKRQLRNCSFAIKAQESQVKQPIEVYLQTDKSVYWPSLDVSGQTLLFTEQDGDREAMWMMKDRIRRPLNFKTIGNFGAPSLTADGCMMYFSMDGGRGGFDIYVSYRLSDSVWSEPVNLGTPINTDGWEAQPAISPDGTRLYFASNREGGRGGSDIWFSQLIRRDADGGQYWSQPRCLYFNTPGDEMAPFLYFDNHTLFFASDGYPGMGKKDIYKVDVDKVSDPINIGITVNTQKDEFGFIVDGGGEWGYFSSDVSGKRCIYRYQLEDIIACSPVNYLRFQVFDEQGHVILPDRLTVAGVVAGDTLAYYDGLYSHQQMLACVPSDVLILAGAVKKGYLYYSDTLRIIPVPGEQVRNHKIILRQIANDRSFVLKGVFFDVDDFHLKQGSYSELQQLAEFLRLNPSVNIEIGGHTDNTGNDEYNYRLSEDRAYEVYKYLFLKRIKKERMSYKGYGKDQPVAPNNSEEGRARNRRTEVKIK